MPATRIGSLFSGAGGLDMAVEQSFGGHTVWHCEVDPAASKVLAHRWPGVPNLGDITTVDWVGVEPIDVLCGGFPCQDVSSAGRRAGIRDGTRSGLWAIFADVIAALRPPIVIIENVRGLLSATAHRPMESEPDALGDGDSQPVLRAIGAVLGDLSDIGYDAQWATVSAASVGAPHRRERVFIVATDADHAARDGQWPRAESRQGNQDAADTAGCIGAAVTASNDATTLDSTGIGAGDRDRTGDTAARVRELGRGTGSESNGDGPVDLLPTPSVADGMGGHLSRSGDRSNELLLPGIVRSLLPTPRRSDGDGGANPLSREERMDDIETRIIRIGAGWGKYAPAIERWETLTRPHPAPTEPSRNGNPRLAPAFSEWMLGWPAGWVTQVPGISRNDQLRIVGNGVCPQQAEAAIRYLLSVSEAVA